MLAKQTIAPPSEMEPILDYSMIAYTRSQIEKRTEIKIDEPNQSSKISITKKKISNYKNQQLNQVRRTHNSSTETTGRRMP